MTWVWLFGLLGFGPDAIDLEALGFYIHNVIGIYQLGDRMLLWNDMDKVICLLDEHGQLVAKYDIQGPGPLEFSKPLVLGVREKDILVSTGNNSVMVFDHSLTPLKAPLPDLKVRHFGGVSRSQGDFIISTARGTEPYALTLAAMERGEWIIKKRIFPNPIDMKTLSPKWYVRVEDGWSYLVLSGIKAGDDYQVLVCDHRQTFEETPTVTLSATLDLPNSGHSRQFVNYAIRYRDLFIATVLVVRASNFERESAWFDIFDGLGQLLDRIEQPRATELIPVQNSDEAWQLNKDTMQLTKLRLDLP